MLPNALKDAGEMEAEMTPVCRCRCRGIVIYACMHAKKKSKKKGGKITTSLPNLASRSNE
jgi:hypothetical protein